jgi:hypothetical protein
MTSKTSKNETLNFETPTTQATTEKEVTMSVDLDSLTVDQLREALSKKEGQEAFKKLETALKVAYPLSTINEFLAVLDGTKVVVSAKGATATEKASTTAKTRKTITDKIKPEEIIKKLGNTKTGITRGKVNELFGLKGEDAKRLGDAWGILTAGKKSTKEENKGEILIQPVLKIVSGNKNSAIWAFK